MLSCFKDKFNRVRLEYFYLNVSLESKNRLSLCNQTLLLKRVLLNGQNYIKFKHHCKDIAKNARNVYPYSIYT